MKMRMKRMAQTTRGLKERAHRSNRLQPANPLTNPKRMIETCAHKSRALGSEESDAVRKTTLN